MGVCKALAIGSTVLGLRRWSAGLLGHAAGKPGGRCRCAPALARVVLRFPSGEISRTNSQRIQNKTYLPKERGSFEKSWDHLDCGTTSPCLLSLEIQLWMGTAGKGRQGD